MGKLFVISTLFLIFLRYNESVAQTDEDAHALRKQLFITMYYDKRIRPTETQSKAIDVFVDLFLLALNEVNEAQESVKLTAFLDIKWVDEFLTWEPKDYGDLESYHWPQDEVWKPRITLRNSYQDYKAFGDDTIDVINYANGVIIWKPFQVLTSTCSLDVTYYPFDMQNCSVQFVAWGYSAEEVVMTGGDKGVVLEQYEPNPRWHLLSTRWDVTYGEDSVIITFTMTLKRVPSYVIFSILLPVLLLTVLNIFAFILPCESGERVGYAITVFLSFAVFFTIISGVLPESVGIFTIYIITMTSQSALICIITIVLVRLSARDEIEQAVPRWMIYMSNIGHCCCFTRRCIGKVGTNKTITVKPVDHDEDMSQVDIKNATTKDPTREKDLGQTWKYTVTGMDYFFTALFALVSVLATSIAIGTCAIATL